MISRAQFQIIMVVCVLTLQSMVVSRLEQGLEPRVFPITAFYVSLYGVFAGLFQFLYGHFLNLGLVSKPWLSNPLDTKIVFLGVHGGLETLVFKPPNIVLWAFGFETCLRKLICKPLPQIVCRLGFL